MQYVKAYQYANIFESEEKVKFYGEIFQKIGIFEE